MKRLGLVALAAVLGGWSWYSVTWGHNEQSLSDGGVCVPLVNVDGGWLDSGVWFDGGVCADGGTGVDCTACSGTCAALQDAGFDIFGLAAGATYTSDPVYASSILTMGCYANVGLTAQANITLQLVGTPDQFPLPDGGLWYNYDGGANSDTYTCAIHDGGSCSGLDFFQNSSTQLWPYSAIRLTNNSDGGRLCCPFGAQ